MDERSGVPAGSDIARMLDALEAPGFIVDENGAVAYVNRAAADCRHERMCLRLALAEAGHAHDAGTRIETAAGTYYVVLPKARPCINDAPPPKRLPESLRRVAELMVRGKTDKEIASVAGLSVATVRTYGTRIYARLGVHNRVELARALRCLGSPTTNG